MKEADQIVWIMNNYYRIHIGYIYNFDINKTELLQERLNEWKKNFNRIFHKNNTTPYVHYFTDHIASEIKEYGDIDMFNTQG